MELGATDAAPGERESCWGCRLVGPGLGDDQITVTSVYTRSQTGSDYLSNPGGITGRLP